MSSENWNLYSALFSLPSCKQLAAAGAMAYWHDCSSTCSWGGKTLKTNGFSSVVTKSWDPHHTVFQSCMLNQGKTDSRERRRCWQLEVSPKINCRKGSNWEVVNGAQALGIFKLSATLRASRTPQFQQNPASYENKPFCDSLNRFDTGAFHALHWAWQVGRRHRRMNACRSGRIRITLLENRKGLNFLYPEVSKHFVVSNQDLHPGLS